jgi:hypothetical protein
MLTIKHFNHRDSSAVNGIPSKGKIHPEIAKKGLMVRQVLKTKKPRRIGRGCRRLRGLFSRASLSCR